MDYNIDTELILNSLEQNIFVKDIHSNYLYVNDTYANLVGEEASALIGKSDLDYFPKDIADKYRGNDALIIQKQIL